MTNQMIDPAESIFSDVKAIERMHETDVPVHVIVDDILQNGKTVAELLNNLIHVSEDERRKEEPNV
jgi:pyrimidine operon attenuation protein/uracil phosphoribosyltransferase